jgi:hypothetical protein
MTQVESAQPQDLIDELRRRGIAVITFTADDLAGFFRSGHPDWRLRPDRYDDEVADWLLRECRDKIENIAWREARVKLIDFIVEAHADRYESETA